MSQLIFRCQEVTHVITEAGIFFDGCAKFLTVIPEYQSNASLNFELVQRGKGERERALHFPSCLWGENGSWFCQVCANLTGSREPKLGVGLWKARGRKTHQSFESINYLRGLFAYFFSTLDMRVFNCFMRVFNWFYSWIFQILERWKEGPAWLLRIQTALP